VLPLAAPAQPTCISPPSDLVSWWRGEGNASDSKDGADGSLYGGATFAPGQVGQCFSFDGLNDAINVPDVAALALTSSLTIEGWLYVTNPPSVPGMVLFRGDTRSGLDPYYVSLEPRAGTSGMLGFVVCGVENINAWINAPMPLEAWTHVAATLDDATGLMTLYTNGVVAAQTTTTIRPLGPLSPGASAGIGIGNHSCQPGIFNYPFRGRIDELSVYSRALSAAEIQGIYTADGLGKCHQPPSIVTQPTSQTVLAGSAVTFTVTAEGTPPLSYQWRFNGDSIAGATATSLMVADVQPAQAGSYSVRVTNAFGSVISSNALLTVIPATTNCAPAPAGLVSWWRAEGNANDAADSNNGLLRGGMAFTTGIVGQAFSFNGSDADIRVPAAPGLNVGLGDGFTIEVWINPADVTEWHPVVEWNSGFFGVNFSVADTSGAGPGSLWIDVKDTGFNDHFFSTAGGLLVSNAWQHVAVTYLKSTGLTVLYINGVPRAQQTLGSFTPRTIGDLYIGLRPYDGGAGARFAGLMDEVSLYNRALTPAEIQTIYSAGGLGKCSLNRTPVAICSNAIVLADTNCQAEASVDGGSFDPDGNPITVSQVPPGPYPLGTNSVTLTVTDDHGASNSCSALVIVLDKTPPVLNCPAGKMVEFQNETGASVTFSVTATDPCSAASVVATPASGSAFPIGTTPVSVQATDCSGNSAQCSFNVTVLGAQGVKSNVLAELVALRPSVTLTEPFAQKFDDAIQHLRDSLDPVYWIDQTHLKPKLGNMAMNEEKLAANRLAEIMDSKQCPVEPALLEGFIDRIVRCDRLLAIISIQEAARAGLNPKKVAQDYALVVKGDREADTGHYANAIEHYRNAWRHALQLQLEVDLNPDGSPRLQFVGNSSKSYLIEVSTDLVNWVPLGTCTADEDGDVEFTDPAVLSESARFYRVAEQ